ncbi:MAG: alpha-E domain-containing protein, partial [Ralstonia sp.]
PRQPLAPSASMAQSLGAGGMTQSLGGMTQSAPGNGMAQSQDAHHLDFYYWAAILRSVSAFEIYRKVYRDVITPARVAELLILRSDMPRSLLASMDEVVSILSTVRNSQSAETERRAGKLHADLRYARIEDIFSVGLHAWLTNFLERIGDLGNGISQDFLVPLEVA